MRITHVIFALNVGGSENMLVDILNEQVKTQQVSLIVINNLIDYSLIETINDRVKIVLIGRKEKSRNIFPIIKLNWFLLLLNPDVIHCHNHTVIQMVIRRNNIVLTAHDINIPIDNFINYKNIFSISKAVKTDIEKRSNIKSILIYNGIKIEDIRCKEDYEFNIFRIIQISRLDHEKKGQHILIEALKILVYEMNVKNICLDLIGDGKSKNYLKKMVNEYRLDTFVSFKGVWDRPYIYEHLKDYDLLIQPSLYEGFGLTIVEAFAAKLPVLISNIDGPLELVGNQLYGEAFINGDSKSCSEKIHCIMNNYENQKLKAIEANLHASQNFDIKLTAINYIENY